MASYKLIFKTSAQREIESLNDRLLERIFPRIESLQEHPRPTGCKKLRGYKDLWRIRIGDYRVIYSIDDAKKALEILRVRHRKDVYEA